MTMKDKYKADNFLFDISAAVDAAVERLKDAYGCALKKYWFLSEKHKEMRTGSWFEITSR